MRWNFQWTHFRSCEEVEEFLTSKTGLEAYLAKEQPIYFSLAPLMRESLKEGPWVKTTWYHNHDEIKFLGPKIKWHFGLDDWITTRDPDFKPLDVCYYREG